MIAYNDLVALGLEAGLSDFGRTCSDDISIVGVDDIEMASAVRPPLTTVKMPIARCGALAVEILLRAMSGAVPEETATLESQLLVRDSTAPPSAGLSVS